MDSERLLLELEKQHRASFGWALACTGRDRREAEDVLQTSYLKVLDGRARFGGASSAKTWFFGVIRRTAQERRRRFWFARLVPDSHAEPSLEADPGVELDERQEAARLVAALGKLAVRQREVLELVFYHDMSIAEAAETLGLKVGTARTHYERGKRGLRKALEGSC